MSYLPKLYGDILARAQADTGTGGLFNSGTPLVTGIFNTFGPRGQAFPHMIFVLESAAQRDAMNTSTRLVQWGLHTYIEEKPASGAAPFAAYSTIMERVLGDWTAQSNRTPSYGFDRWTPTLSGSGWSATITEHTGSRTSHETGFLHFIEDFQVWVSKAGT